MGLALPAEGRHLMLTYGLAALEYLTCIEELERQVHRKHPHPA
jgi:hypothetical protein